MKLEECVKHECPLGESLRGMPMANVAEQR